MTEREHKAAKRKRKIANRKRREQQIMMNTPPSSPRTEPTRISDRRRGKKFQSEMKTAIVRDTLGIDQLKQKQTGPKNNSLVEKIRVFLDVTMCQELQLANKKLLLVKNLKCRKELVKYPLWARKSETIEKSGKRVKITKNMKEIFQETVADLIRKFNQKDLKKHIYNIKVQYKCYPADPAAIGDLKSDEVVLHIDYSENYSCKHFKEVQSHHFG
ncbi:hypothetical protein HHI36_005415 [Cryptolaemus montrouzieri]|uniref:40S ribosomal protein S7 n=1 Tax=Cryptolaemus montrouzieri TaxID=559131 RepID=A0ABD2NV45_9CUCU